RGRIKRNTIEHERDGERVFVLVDADKPLTSHSQSIDRPSDQPHDQHPDENDHARELVEELRDRVAFLERELERRNNELEQRGIEATRYQEIVAGLTQANARLSARVPELPAASHEEPRESRETAAQDETKADTPTASASPQKGAQRRSWWRRLVGG
ncbi:MAG: hypothetical protein M3Q49_21120, partial [Actinomycetota bacterium]|nr:hypothetical protein [Actinomycetota bacterium]